MDYKHIVCKLKETLPFTNSVIIIEGESDIVYSTDDWRISADIKNLDSIWESKKIKSITIAEEKYSIILRTKDRVVATSFKGKGHVVGVRDNKSKILIQIEEDGIIPFSFIEMFRILASINPKENYIDRDLVTGNKAQNMIATSFHQNKISQKNVETDSKTEKSEADIPFTARLMAYYRAQESKREHSLIIDPFAELLAGDLAPFLKEHIRYSEMDYPIVRSYFIEENLLTPWCNAHSYSQIVLLGAGLDTRAYRFEPFKKNNHIIYEIDFPIVIDYKEKLMKNHKPFCDVIRIAADLVDQNWSSCLIEKEFSKEIPSFWILEGLVYYMKQEDVFSLLKKMAEHSKEGSEIFIDLIHASRWVPFPYSQNENISDPFSKYQKWGLNIKEIDSFFVSTGWNVTTSFVDEYDQGRNVGQKGMVFIHGIKKTE